MTTVGQIRQGLEKAYPPHLAESWDKVGLICGDPQAEVTKVAFALDCTLEVARDAVASGAQLLVVHHPLLLRGTHTVAADTPKGEVLHLLITNGVALFAAHTNADSARPGVNDRLAELVGIVGPTTPIAPKDPEAADLWGVHVPHDSLEQVKQSLFDVGAGHIGNYSHCGFSIDGRGQFTPENGADPAEGTVGELYTAPEVRFQFVAPRSKRTAILAALRDSHPYEEPAYDIVETASSADPTTLPGLGRVGLLQREMSLQEFVEHVAQALPSTAWGVRACGDPQQRVRKVAVSSGAGDSFLDAVRGLDVDVYVTSDLRHHPVDEYRRAGGPAVVDTAHWASEFPWTSQASEVVNQAYPHITVKILNRRTDPWTISAHGTKED